MDKRRIFGVVKFKEGGVVLHLSFDVVFAEIYVLHKYC